MEEELDRAGIGRHFQKFRFNGMEWLNADVKKTLFGYLRDAGKNIESGRGLVLCGPKGVGKTTLLALVARATLHFWKESNLVSCRSVKYTTAYDLCRFCSRDDEYYMKIRRVSLLLLDDFGAEYSHDWPLSTLSSIIDYRYANDFPTCISTNITPEALANKESDEYRKYGRIIDRMNEASNFLIVEINAASQRK